MQDNDKFFLNYVQQILRSKTCPNPKKERVEQEGWGFKLILKVILTRRSRRVESICYIPVSIIDNFNKFSIKETAAEDTPHHHSPHSLLHFESNV
jgi:hypothetical protein